MRRLLFVGSLIVSVSCGSDSPGSGAVGPSSSSATLNGTVSATGGARIAGATVRVFDGRNAGRSAVTNASGDFSLPNLMPGNANVTANATICDEVVRGVFLNGTTTADFVFPVPSCQVNNTASVAFENQSATATQVVAWDGVIVATLAPGALSGPLIVTAGIPHTLSFLVHSTGGLACTDSSPAVPQCQRGGVFTCTGP